MKRASRTIDDIARGIGEILGSIGAWIDEHIGGRSPAPAPIPIPVDDDRGSRDDRTRDR